MKIKLFLMALMLTFGALSISYASFPVQRTTTNNTTVVENNEDELIRIITGDLQPKDGSYAKTL